MKQKPFCSGSRGIIQLYSKTETTVCFWADAGSDRVAQSSTSVPGASGGEGGGGLKKKQKKKQACGSPQRCLLTGGQCCGTGEERTASAWSPPEPQ